MKLLIVFLSCLSLVVNEKINTFQLFSPDKLQNVNYSLFLKRLNDTVNSTIRKSSGGIVANLNEFVDELLKNLGEEIVNKGYDPSKLPDETLNLLHLGKITIDKGWLRDLSMLSRYKDAELSYSSTDKLMALNFAIEFEVLQFTYNYLTKVPLITIHGELEGKVENVKLELKIGFDFHTYQVSLDEFNIMDTGKISIKFFGHSLVDWITNAMTSVVTTFLHPVILEIIQNIIKNHLTSLIDAINDVLRNIIHP